jgi:hypothetical protein
MQICAANPEAVDTAHKSKIHLDFPGVTVGTSGDHRMSAVMATTHTTFV